MNSNYPPVSFFFEVIFEDKSWGNVETRFQSVTGLSVDMQTETFKEGGENRFEHTLPVRSKFTPLVLKRGLVKNSKLMKWCTDAIIQFDITPKNLQVRLLHVKPSNSRQPSNNPEPLMTWKVINAWPKKWSVSDFNAEQNAIAIESMELQYSYFEPMK